MGAFDEAIAFAVANESPWSRDPARGRWGVHVDDPAPYDRLLGPVSARGPCSGLVTIAGREVAHWGEPGREDLTFSVAKTYLALLAGVAFDRGLMPDVDEAVARRVPGIGFEGPRNGAVTWAQLLTQTSEWEGSCFGLPDTVDRYRHVSSDPRAQTGRKGDARPLQPPGTYWEYNDVRINQLSLALLHLFACPLPEVFAEAIATPCGASADWRWAGYDHAWVDVAGRRVQSVPGGTHWGAGVSIDCRDQARIGQMLLRGGMAGDRRVLSREWIARMLVPCALAPFYGYLVWLNTGRGVYPSLPASSWFMIGAGTSIVWIDPARDAVLVLRWIDSAVADAILGRFSAALSACAKDLGLGVKGVPGEPE